LRAPSEAETADAPFLVAHPDERRVLRQQPLHLRGVLGVDRGKEIGGEQHQCSGLARAAAYLAFGTALSIALRSGRLSCVATERPIDD
jgi:hypothetical protein